MNTQDDMNLARPLAPEDITAGDHVCVLSVMYEVLPPCFEARPGTCIEPVRVACAPRGGGLPMKVIDTCLPYVLVKRHDGKHRTLDIRRHKLARVSKRFAREVRKRWRKDTGPPPPQPATTGAT